MSGKNSPFPDHNGKATWGDRVVELDTFVEATQRSGRALDEAARTTARQGWLRPAADSTSIEGPFKRVLVFGGVYSNHHALRAVLERSRKEKVDAVYCLGDLGGFGPRPENVHPLLVDHDVRVIQGNYEQSLSSGAADCNCGYTDPRDNHFAELSYRYTDKNCSPEFKRWMGELPQRRRVRVGEKELLLVHGSPRQVNEFLFESTASVNFLEKVLDRERCDAVLCTHTGLHWHRRLPSGRDVVNVGVIGRPANDGSTHVWYATITAAGQALDVEFHELPYDHEALIREMRDENLPREFIETIRTGWWTTCLEVLPARERERSRF
jgi:predicted phosphodiesterase